MQDKGFYTHIYIYKDISQNRFEISLFGSHLPMYVAWIKEKKYMPEPSNYMINNMQ